MTHIKTTMIVLLFLFVVGIVMAEDQNLAKKSEHVQELKPCGAFPSTEGACPAGCWASFLIEDNHGIIHCHVVTKHGYYSLENETWMRPCDVGFYSDEERSTACKPCDVGSYTRDVASTVCKLCPKGYYQNEKGQKECLPCSPFYYDGLGANNAVVDAGGDVYCDFVDTNDHASASASPSTQPSTEPTSMGNGTGANANEGRNGPSRTFDNAGALTPDNPSDLPIAKFARAPFITMATAFALLFVVSMVTVIVIRRPRKGDDTGTQSGKTDNSRSPEFESVNGPMRETSYDHRHNLGIAPFPRQHENEFGAANMPPPVQPLRFRQRHDPMFFSPDARDPFDDGVIPQAPGGRPAVVTPYYPDEAKMPEASFEDFEYCYEDPEIANGFVDVPLNENETGDGSVAYAYPGVTSIVNPVSRASLAPSDEDEQENEDTTANVSFASLSREALEQILEEDNEYLSYSPVSGTSQLEEI